MACNFSESRRRLLPPDPDLTNGFTFFKPATGTKDPLSTKAMVMANDTTRVGIVTVDAVGILSELVDRIHAKAISLGATIPRENLVVSASPTHAGPGTEGLDFATLLSTVLPLGPVKFKMGKDWFANDFRFRQST